MFLFKKSEQLSAYLKSQRCTDNKIAFVPTMGALHDGHLSLIKQASAECNLVVVSIFVNPTQFNDKNDLKKYPRPIQTDIDLLLHTNAQVLFLPSEKEIYPERRIKLKQYSLGFLDLILEAACRPGHFQGVANVVNRLLNIVKPDYLYLGQKDFQQVMVIKKLIQIEKHETIVRVGETIRQSDGLALSSRNIQLSPVGRKKASGISGVLFYLKENKNKFTSVNDMRKKGVSMLSDSGVIEIDYLEVCDAKTLQPLNILVNGIPAVILIAVKIENVRLIDNVMI